MLRVSSNIIGGRHMAIRDDYEMIVGLEVHCELSTKTKRPLRMTKS